MGCLGWSNWGISPSNSNKRGLVCFPIVSYNTTVVRTGRDAVCIDTMSKAISQKNVKYLCTYIQYIPSHTALVSEVSTESDEATCITFVFIIIIILSFSVPFLVSSFLFLFRLQSLCDWDTKRTLESRFVILKCIVWYLFYHVSMVSSVLNLTWVIHQYILPVSQRLGI